jgi:hypothetical protein
MSSSSVTMIDAVKFKKVIAACEREGCMDALMHMLAAMNVSDGMSPAPPTDLPSCFTTTIAAARATSTASVLEEALAAYSTPVTPPKARAGGVGGSNAVDASAGASGPRPVLSASGTKQSWIDAAKARGEKGLYGKDCSTKALLQAMMISRGWVFA